MFNKSRTLAAFIFAFSCATAQSTELTAVGPVEAVAPNGQSFRVLGQTFMASSGTVLSRASVAQMGSLVDLSVGDFVLVTAKRMSNGTHVVKAVGRAGTDYVPGATSVYFSGIISGTDLGVGVIYVDGTAVNVTDALVSRPIELRIGAAVEVLGSQPAPGGLVLASQLLSTADLNIRDSLQVLSIIRGDANLATAESIQGTGVQSIQGTGIQSIQGTGIQGAQGTAIQSIQGTGKQSIQGTGIQSIQGTGKQSIQGTGILSIQGTGKQSIQGTGRQSIQGTGVRQ